jgi:hypothetical protein
LPTLAFFFLFGMTLKLTRECGNSKMVAKRCAQAGEIGAHHLTINIDLAVAVGDTVAIFSCSFFPGLRPMASPAVSRPATHRPSPTTASGLGAKTPPTDLRSSVDVQCTAVAAVTMQLQL